MVNFGFFAIRAKVVGVRDPISYSSGFKYVLGTYSESLWCEMGWATHYSEKMKIVTDYLTKPHYSNKQDTISFFVSHGPQILTTSASMVRFRSLGHVCRIKYLKLTILAFSVFPD